MDNAKMQELINALTENMSAEEVLLATMKGQIAAEITLRRTNKGLNQTQLAEKMGVKQATVSKWESGETNYTLETLCRLAVALDINIQCPFEAKPENTHYTKVYNFSEAATWRASDHYGTHNYTTIAM